MLLITGARLGDLYGRRRMYLLGATVFTLTSLICGMAPNSATLIAVVKIGRIVRRIKDAGAASRTTFRDRGRAAARRVRRIASTLRLRGAEARQEAQATVFRITAELATLVDRAAAEATVVARNARRSLRSPSRISGRARGRLVRAVNELDTLLERAARVIAQARLRLGGGKPDSATRLVSLHDPQARPIRKGRIDRPVEFGYKAQVVDNTDGIVVDHNVEEGNPADGPQLEPAIRRIHRQRRHRHQPPGT